MFFNYYWGQINLFIRTKIQSSINIFKNILFVFKKEKMEDDWGWYVSLDDSLFSPIKE